MSAALPAVSDPAAACEECLRRPWLLARLSGHLDRTGSRLEDLLNLEEPELLDALTRRRPAPFLGPFNPHKSRALAARHGVELICRCHPRYPASLRRLPRPPSVLHVAGGLERFLQLAAADPVALVGTRRASAYGLDVGGSLGRGLAAAGLTVVSGMAHGIDTAAHEGALLAGSTIAVLAGGAERAYPGSARGLHRRIVAAGAVVSELPTGTALRRWMFPARNRLIAALATMTVVVEAPERSGALLTARQAAALGRSLGAVPGRITSTQAAGPNRLLREGATLVAGPQDVLDALYGLGRRVAVPDSRVELGDDLRHWLDVIAAGHDSPETLGAEGLSTAQVLQVLSELELAGYVRRETGGRFAVIP